MHCVCMCVRVCTLGRVLKRGGASQASPPQPIFGLYYDIIRFKASEGIVMQTGIGRVSVLFP